mmetsp:Transcript_2106/g.3239  ORF Transcript_2106/g.3239 Transcript_2106/m.3239 type:complete len:93 (-) Transcript_2106:453-731(-)
MEMDTYVQDYYRQGKSIKEPTRIRRIYREGEKYKPHQGRPYRMTRTHTVAAQGSAKEGNYRNPDKADDTFSRLLPSFTFYFLYCCLMLIVAA